MTVSAVPQIGRPNKSQRQGARESGASFNHAPPHQKAPRLTSARDIVPDDVLEAEADATAEAMVRGQGTRAGGGVPGLSITGHMMLARKCMSGACACPSCGGGEQRDNEEEPSTARGGDVRLQRAAFDDATSPAPVTPLGGVPDAATVDSTDAAAAPTTDTAAPSAGTDAVIVEDGQPVGERQISRTEFMGRLRAELTGMCNAELAAIGRDADGCPYLEGYLGYYGTRSAAQLERTGRSYLGALPSNADALVEAVVSRVRAAVRIYAATGKITGTPSGAPPAAAGGGTAPAASPPSETGTMQRKSMAAAGPGAVAPSAATSSPAAIRESLTAGQPLDGGVRRRLESGFGSSFANVRVHTDPTAQRLTGQVSARAFTIGDDIAFNAGEYRPGTLEGDLLIAHELAHTIQQGGGRAPAASAGASADQVLEQDADEAALGAVGSAAGLLERRPPSRRSGLALQGCGRTVKRCPPGSSWRVATAVGVGPVCDCYWRCMPGERPGASSGGDNGPAFTCPPDAYCDKPRIEIVDDKYQQIGKGTHAVGAHMTPLGEEAACGCLPLDMEGEKVSDVPLRPSDFEMTDLVGPMVDMAAGLKAKNSSSKSGGAPETDPTTGTRIPGKTPDIPRPVNPVQTMVVEAGLYSEELRPRLDRVFKEADPAVMTAIEGTVRETTGQERVDRLRKVLNFADKRPSIPDVIKEGPTFGKGGTGSVAEVVGRPDLASKQGGGRAGAEAAAMVQLELAGVPTVYLAERATEDGSSRLVLRRIDGVGSKDIIGRAKSGPPDPTLAKQYEQYVTPKTISDLETIRQRLVDAKLNVGDFQFIVQRTDGAVFINDPTGVTPNSGPSGDVDNIIDRFRAIVRRRQQGPAK
jgi:hypothetical protein